MSDEREEQEQKRKFKVVDRRRFDADGEMREEAKEAAAAQAKAPAPPPSAAKPPAPQAKAPPPSEAPAAPPPGAEEDDEDIAIPFGAFLQSLAQQCVMQLGMMPLPSGQRHLDLEGARDTIDILAMLQVKTKGNLSADEADALKQILYELRMTFMEIANKVAAAQAPMAGPPGGKPPGM
jgi:hypothetical protein